MLKNNLHLWCILGILAGAAVLGKTVFVAHTHRVEHTAVTLPVLRHDDVSTDGYYTVPRSPLPKTLSPRALGTVQARAVYAMAGRIRGVLDQLPCYCDCGRALGHRSLLDCYTGRHASVCSICLLEAAFAYKETARGETPSQIRAQLGRGAWWRIDLKKECAAFR
jgi:hypothetical protein